MMSSYQTITPLQLRFIDQKIHSVAWNQTKFVNFFQRSPGTRWTTNPVTGEISVDGGLVRNVEEGLEQITLTTFEKMKPGQIAGGIQNIPKQKIRLYQETQPLTYLATKIEIPINFVHAWNNNRLIEAKDILATALAEVMKPLANQVDQFLAYGTDMLTPLSFDRMKQNTKFTGLFNGFTAFGGGAGGDDDVGDAGDYIATYVNAKLNLQTQGFDTGPYFIMSDNTTAAAAQQNNNLYKTYAPVTEYDHIKKNYADELYGWIDSVNAFPNSDTDQHRICVTQPFISVQGKKIEPAYALYLGYNFRVFNLWNGGLNDNMAYEFAVIWSGRLQTIGPSGPYALYHTGNSSASLTLT